VKGEEGQVIPITLAVALVNKVSLEPVSKRILQFYARKWDDAQKLEFIHHLIAANYFRKGKKPPSCFSIQSALKNMRFENTPASVISLLVLLKVINEFTTGYIQSLGKPKTLEMVQYLSDQLQLPKHKRPEGSFDLGFTPSAATDDILNMMELICAKLDIPLPATYFRFTRPKFVEQLFEDVREGRVSFSNAVNKAVAIAGRTIKGLEKEDQIDTILDLVRWPNLAREVAKKLDFTDPIPTFHNIDPFLDAPTTCRKWLHEQQRHEMMFILRNKKDLDMMTMMTDDPNFSDANFFIVDVVKDENPTLPRQMVKPTLIAFFTTYSPPFAFFPDSLAPTLSKALFDYLAKRPLLVNLFGNKEDLAVIKKYFNKPKPKLKDKDKKQDKDKEDKVQMIDFSSDVAADKNLSTSDTSFKAIWCWEGRFCGVSSKEWITDPLTVSQSYHLAYKMNLLADVIEKYGTEKIMAQVK